MTTLNTNENYLVELKLHGIRGNLSKRLKDGQEEKLANEQFLGLCLFDEIEHRRNAKVQRLVHNATFRSSATPEGLDFAASRNLDKKQVAELSTSRFVEEGHNLLIVGPTGVGKSYLATAIGLAACRNRHSTLFFRMNTLIEKLSLVSPSPTPLDQKPGVIGTGDKQGTNGEQTIPPPPERNPNESNLKGKRAEGSLPKAEGREAEDIASNSRAHREHTVSNNAINSRAIHEHIASKKSNKTDITSNSHAISRADTLSNREQFTSTSRAHWDASAVSGKEAFLLQIVFRRCKNSGSITTEKISSEHLAESLKVSTVRLNNLVARLIAKQLLEVTAFKTGRGSWRQFRLPNAVYQELTLSDIASNSQSIHERFASISPPISHAISRAEPSSSSSFLLDLDNKKSTTTSEGITAVGGDGALPPDWIAIDPSPLEPIRFTETHLRQLASRNRRSPKEVQDSIYAFAFDLEVNGKGNELRSPLNFFMKILHDGPYAPPENYESPAVRQLRIYLESQQKELQKLREIENKIESLEFEKWANKLSLEKREELVPSNGFAKPGGTAHTVQLREYFREHVWPSLRERTSQN